MDLGRGGLGMGLFPAAETWGAAGCHLPAQTMTPPTPKMKAQEGQRQPGSKEGLFILKARVCYGLWGRQRCRSVRFCAGERQSRWGFLWGRLLAGAKPGAWGPSWGQALTQSHPKGLGAAVQGQGACPESALLRGTGPPSSGPSKSPGPVAQTHPPREGRDRAEGQLSQPHLASPALPKA